MIELEIHTDDEVIRNACERYWKLDDEGSFVGTVRSIASDLGVSQRALRELIRENCTAYSTDLSCERCGSLYVFSSRSDCQSPSLKRRYGSDLLCADCQEELREEQRLARENAQRERQEQLAKEGERKRQIMLQQFGYTPERRIEIADVSLEEAIYLISIVRLGASEDYSQISPLGSFEDRLAPTPSYIDEILSILPRGGLIGIHPGSDPDSVILEDERIARYYPLAVTWRLTVGRDIVETVEVISELERAFKDMDWPEHWEDAWAGIARKIALAECLEYLDHCMSERGFEFSPGPKTLETLNNVLDSYSVAQAYNFIWVSSKNASDFYVRKRPPKRQAANSVVGSIQKRAERARDEGWDIKPFRRDFNCPRTMVSYVLFSSALHNGDGGFNQVVGNDRARAL